MTFLGPTSGVYFFRSRSITIVNIAGIAPITKKTQKIWESFCWVVSNALYIVKLRGYVTGWNWRWSTRYYGWSDSRKVGRPYGECDSKEAWDI